MVELGITTLTNNKYTFESIKWLWLIMTDRIELREIPENSIVQSNVVTFPIKSIEMYQQLDYGPANDSKKSVTIFLKDTNESKTYIQDEYDWIVNAASAKFTLKTDLSVVEEFDAVSIYQYIFTDEYGRQKTVTPEVLFGNNT